MDQDLEGRWLARQAPFDGETLYLDECIPLAHLRTTLLSFVAGLQEKYQAASLLAPSDWHEHDGYLSSRQSITWRAIEQLLASEQLLYDGHAGDGDVRHIYYPSDSSFLLRIYVVDDADEEEGYPGRRGDCDLSGAPGLLDSVSAQVSETTRRLLRREPSGAYFDRKYGG